MPYAIASKVEIKVLCTTQSCSKKFQKIKTLILTFEANNSASLNSIFLDFCPVCISYLISAKAISREAFFHTHRSQEKPKFLSGPSSMIWITHFIFKFFSLCGGAAFWALYHSELENDLRMKIFGDFRNFTVCILLFKFSHIKLCIKCIELEKKTWNIFSYFAPADNDGLETTNVQPLDSQGPPAAAAFCRSLVYILLHSTF